ncbi:MAG TPA: hypothetical protein VE090_02820 [Methylomirabilota bacterium]|nr:hypothetical protein [Methylomirabilota bacterium]
MVSVEMLEKFKRLYLEKYNVSLTNEEATRMATDLVNLMKILLRPDKPTDNQQERRQDETISTHPH